MKKILLTADSKLNIERLMLNETIRNKVMSAGEEGRTYIVYQVRDSGIVVLGETKTWWWNRLVKCQFPLTFHAFVSAVWDALVDLSAGGNKEALEKGLGRELMEKSQREKEYNWVVKRLQECYDHVCNNKGGADLEGSQRKSGSSVAHVAVPVNNPVNVNVNIDGKVHKKMRFPDATGKAFLECELGVVGVHTVIEE
jgi:hypothetical protein